MRRLRRACGNTGRTPRPKDRPPPLWRFAKQFQSPLIYILLFALAADAAIWVSEGATGLPVESIAIAVILLLNAGLGVYQESKSEAALARLKEMAAPMVWVMREGNSFTCRARICSRRCRAHRGRRPGSRRRRPDRSRRGDG